MRQRAIKEGQVGRKGEQGAAGRGLSGRGEGVSREQWRGGEGEAGERCSDSGPDLKVLKAGERFEQVGKWSGRGREKRVVDITEVDEREEEGEEGEKDPSA